MIEREIKSLSDFEANYIPSLYSPALYLLPRDLIQKTMSKFCIS
jgi:hypothetical protein